VLELLVSLKSLFGAIFLVIGIVLAALSGKSAMLALPCILAIAIGIMLFEL